MPIYTAQYRYSGMDRLDITVKGNCPAGKLYAPTWQMIQGYKNNRFSEADYTKMYYDLLQQRWRDNYLDFRASTTKLVDIICGGTNNMPPRDITLVCFCPTNTFCHRYLLVNWLTHNWSQVKYGGERKF